jgi:tetratricopeptide (TPR) repeat protein
MSERPAAAARALLLAFALLPAAVLADARTQGEALLRAGRFEEAAEQFEKAVAQSPKDAEAHSLLAQAYGAQAGAGGMITKMRLAGRIRDHFERAVTLAPEEIRYREALLEFYLQAPSAVGGGLDKAQAEAAQIAKRDRVRGLLASGRIARLDGDAELALSKYRQAATEQPGDAGVVLRLVIFLQELKRWPEAFERLDALVARDASAGAAWYQLGRTAVLSNSRHADGESALKRFISMPRGENSPPPEAAHWRLGMLYEQMGRNADAKQQYRQALQRNPQHKESKAALKKLG